MVNESSSKDTASFWETAFTLHSSAAVSCWGSSFAMRLAVFCPQIVCFFHSSQGKGFACRLNKEEKYFSSGSSGQGSVLSLAIRGRLLQIGTCQRVVCITGACNCVHSSEPTKDDSMNCGNLLLCAHNTKTSWGELQLFFDSSSPPLICSQITWPF